MRGGVFSRLGVQSGGTNGAGYIGQPAMAASWSKVTVSVFNIDGGVYYG